jgi:hypothetical protein
MEGYLMLRRIVTLSILAMILFSCSAPLMMKTQQDYAADEESALVTFLRPGSGLTSFVSGDQPSEMWDGDQLIGVLKGDQYFQYKTKPGKHLFVSRAGNWSFLEADLAAGKHYGVFVKSAPGWKPFGGNKTNIILIPVTKDSEWLEKCHEWHNKCVALEPIPENITNYEKKLKNRVQDAIKNEREGNAESLFLDPEDYIDEF